MKRILLLLLPLIIIGEPSLLGQQKYDFSQFGHETWDFFKQPTKWDGSDWLKLGLMSAGSFLMMETIDKPIRDVVMKDRSYFYSAPIEFGRMYGELYSPVVFFGGFALHSLLTGSTSSRKIAYEIGQASLYAGAITYFIKIATGRSRPYTEEGPLFFRPFTHIFNDAYRSFPGGHTTVAFIISTVLSRNTSSGLLKVLFYLPALLTPISRIYQDQHWTSSNVFGGLTGYLIATWVVDQHEHKESIMGISSVFPLTITIPL